MSVFLFWCFLVRCYHKYSFYMTISLFDFPLTKIGSMISKFFFIVFYVAFFSNTVNAISFV